MNYVLQRIIDLRLAREWSEYELAKRADMAQSTVSAWYQKDAFPSIPSLEKVCAAFGITMSAFFHTDKDSNLTEEQMKLLEQYSALNKVKKEKLEIFLNEIL